MALQAYLTWLQVSALKVFSCRQVERNADDIGVGVQRNVSCFVGGGFLRGRMSSFLYAVKSLERSTCQLSPFFSRAPSLLTELNQEHHVIMPEEDITTVIRFIDFFPSINHGVTI